MANCASEFGTRLSMKCQNNVQTASNIVNKHVQTFIKEMFGNVKTLKNIYRKNVWKCLNIIKHFSNISSKNINFKTFPKSAKFKHFCEKVGVPQTRRF